MRLFNAPAAVLGLLAFAYLPSTLAKPYPVHIEEFSDLHNGSQIEKRQCAGQLCGFYKQLCCAAGQQCITDNNNQAQCSGGQVGGGWQYFTTTWVEPVGVTTYTSVYSSYVGGAAQPTSSCKSSQSPCGGKCCDSGFWCNASENKCVLIAGGSTGGILPTAPGTLGPSAPLRPTNSGLVIVTYTGRPTATVPFQTPIPTGAVGGAVPVEGDGGGLSGGAIAGIIIGVLLGILLLLLLCLFCCARALFDTIIAIFGLGKKKKHTHEETYIEEHHHGSGGAAGGRWYGQGRPSRPSRPGSEKKSGIGKGMGVAAALGGLALMLGLKRKHDKRHDDKSTTVSGSSYYYSDYTSSSKLFVLRDLQHFTNNHLGSASSSDRRTRNTRHSSRR